MTELLRPEDWLSVAGNDLAAARGLRLLGPSFATKAAFFPSNAPNGRARRCSFAWTACRN